MLQKSFILPPSKDYSLYTTANRYWLPEFDANAANPAALTLVVLHSTSFHKEIWEPALEDLFDLARQPGSQIVIEDAWAIDCPNHGESAVLNHRPLTQPEFGNFSCEKYARAVYRFLDAGLEQGARVDFRKRNLIGIGHSLGANSMLMLQEVEPRLSFSCLIIIEPMVSAEGAQHLSGLRKKLVSYAENRRSKWVSREEAYESFRSKLPWDLRVLKAYVDHAIHWNEERKLYVLSCKREHEIAMYMDEQGPTRPVQALNRVCHLIPVHLILGEKDDLIPEFVQKALVNPDSGRRYASVDIIQGVGHLIPQQEPGKLAMLISRVLLSYALKSRL